MIQVGFGPNPVSAIVFSSFHLTIIGVNHLRLFSSLCWPSSFVDIFVIGYSLPNSVLFPSAHTLAWAEHNSLFPSALASPRRLFRRVSSYFLPSNPSFNFTVLKDHLSRRISVTSACPNHDIEMFLSMGSSDFVFL